VKDSLEEGRDSWLLKKVFGKNEDEVVETKFFRQVAADVLLGFDSVCCIPL
jgi:hypothetical protein